MSVAIVTGIGSPVGRAVVEKLGTMGFTVSGFDFTEAGEGRRPVADAVKQAVDKTGVPSVLVTCPSLHDAAPFGEMPAERWHRLLNAHLGATTNACAAVVPMMIEAGRGTVITTSSWLAYAGVAGETYQAAATGAVLAFTKSFALEVARHGVRVNCIAVGDVAPADVAETVRFLVEDGDFFVGQVLVAAGGKLV